MVTKMNVNHMSRNNLITIMNLIIIATVVFLSNFVKSEEIITTKQIPTTTIRSYLNENENNKNQTDLIRSPVISNWLDSIITNLWNWLTTNDQNNDVDEQNTSRMTFSGNGIIESRTFGKIKRLQFALLPIMFKFGVLSTLVSALVFLALKTIFLLKALFIVNLAVVFGKFFAWKTELTKNHNSGGSGGGWGPPPNVWGPPAWPPVHSYVHSPSIIEASHPPSDGNKEIHVHVHTNKEEKEEHHNWNPTPQFHHDHHEFYHDVHEAPSNKQNSYVVNGVRERRNNDEKPKNLITKPVSNDHPRLLSGSSSSSSSSGSSSGSSRNISKNISNNSQEQVEIKSVLPKVSIQKPIHEVQSQKPINVTGKTSRNLSHKLEPPPSSYFFNVRKQKKQTNRTKRIPIPLKSQKIRTYGSNKSQKNF